MADLKATELLANGELWLVIDGGLMEAEKTETNQGFVTKYDMMGGWMGG